MLKFFRRIRQKLIDEGNLKRYLIYAIGEILLVVIGILIALQLNYWNEDRINRASEEFYLNQLSVELESDKRNLQNDLFNFEEKPVIIKNFIIQLNMENNEGLFNSSLNDYINKVVSIPYFRPNTSTFDELKSTGKLSIIRNKELVNKLIHLYNNYDILAQFIQIDIDFLMPMDRNFVYELGIGKFLGVQKPIFGEYITANDVFELKKSKDILENHAAVHHWIAMNLIPRIEAELEELEDVIQLINNELIKN